MRNTATCRSHSPNSARIWLYWVEWLGVADRIYVDVGCFDPIICSNTLLLHKSGWRGVNIDVNSEKIRRFNEARPADFNVAMAVSSTEQPMRFLRYDDGMTNRLHRPDDRNTLSAIGAAPRNAVELRTATLDQVLGSAPWPIEAIGYLNIDCEGHDFDVLAGLNLSRYRPRIITIEALNEAEEDRIYKYLVRLGYERSEKFCKSTLYLLPK